MTKRKMEWTEEKYNRFIKEGRGSGQLGNYKPWWTIQDFPSSGKVSRVLGWKTGRIHHFLSDLETNFFYMCEWNDYVIDIREHFPLLEFDSVVDKKADLKTDKYKDKNTGVQYVITTTFLLTLKNLNGKHNYIARSIKGSSNLLKSAEKLEMERRYWKAKNIDWGIVTEKEIDVVKAKNIEWIHSALRDSDEFGISAEQRNYYSNILLERLYFATGELSEVLRSLDEQFNLEHGTALYIFKYLIASKIIKVDLSKKIDITRDVRNMVDNTRV